LLESTHALAQTDLVAYVKKGVSGLSLDSIYSLEISGQRTGHPTPDWTETITFQAFPGNGNSSSFSDESIERFTSDVESLGSLSDGSDSNSSDLDLDLELRALGDDASLDGLNFETARGDDLDLNLDLDSVMEASQSASTDDLDLDLDLDLNTDGLDADSLDLDLDASDLEADGLDLDLNTNDLETSSLDLDLDTSDLEVDGLDLDLDTSDLNGDDLDLDFHSNNASASDLGAEDLDLDLDTGEVEPDSLDLDFDNSAMASIDTDLDDLDLEMTDATAGFDEDLDINQLQEATDELNSALSDLNMTETSDDQGDDMALESFDASFSLDLDTNDSAEANPDSSIEFDLTETSTEALSAIVDEAPDRAFTGAEPPEFDLNFETADTNFDTPDLDLDFDSAEFAPEPPELNLDSSDTPSEAAAPALEESFSLAPAADQELDWEASSSPDGEEAQGWAGAAAATEPQPLSLGEGLEGDLWSSNADQDSPFVSPTSSPAASEATADIDWDLNETVDFSPSESAPVDENVDSLDFDSAEGAADLDWDLDNDVDLSDSAPALAEENSEILNLDSVDAAPDLDWDAVNFDEPAAQVEGQPAGEVEPVDLMLREELDLSADDDDLSFDAMPSTSGEAEMNAFLSNESESNESEASEMGDMTNQLDDISLAGPDFHAETFASDDFDGGDDLVSDAELPSDSDADVDAFLAAPPSPVHRLLSEEEIDFNPATSQESAFSPEEDVEAFSLEETTETAETPPASFSFDDGEAEEFALMDDDADIADLMLDDAEVLSFDPPETATDEELSLDDGEADTAFFDIEESAAEADLSLDDGDAAAVFTEPEEFSVEEEVSFADSDAAAVFTEPEEFSVEEEVSFPDGDAAAVFTEPEEFSNEADFSPADVSAPGLKPEDFPLFDRDQNASGEAFLSEAAANAGQEQASGEDTLRDTLELNASRIESRQVDASTEFSATEFSADDSEPAEDVDFTSDDNNAWDDENAWTMDDQPDATDEFINEVTDNGDDFPSTSVNLTEEDLDNLDNSGKGAGGSAMNWLVGLGVGVVCLGLLGILFNAFLGNRQTTEPVTEQPIEMPVPADGETETPDAEAPAPEPEEPVAEEPEAAEPEPQPEASAEVEYFREAVNAAQNAANLAQTASTGAEWQAVADSWNRAIELMKQVPESDPDYATAQQKAVDYQPNLEYAQQNAERL